MDEMEQKAREFWKEWICDLTDDQLLVFPAMAAFARQQIEAEREAADKIIREEWHKAVASFGLRPGSQVEAVMGAVIDRVRARSFYSDQRDGGA